jgi:hypothetical protein
MTLWRYLTARREAPVRPGLAAACGFLAVVGLMALLEWRLLLLNAGLPLLDWESAERLLMCRRWAEDPFLWNPRGWLPLFFILHGAALRLLGHPWLVPALLNTLLSAAGLWAFWGVARRLSPGPGPQALALVALCGLSRLFIEFNLQARVDPLFILCVFAGVRACLDWCESGGLRPQLLCALAFAAAAFTRYEGWAFALAFLILAWGRPRLWPAFLVLLPIAAWLGIHWATPPCDPLSFLPSISQTAHPMNAGLNGANLEKFLSALLLGTPADFSRETGLALPLAGLAVLCGGILLWRQGGSGRVYLALAGLPVAAMGFMAVVLHYPVDASHMVVFHMLTLALLAPVLGRLLRSLRMPAAALALLTAWLALLIIGFDQRRPQNLPSTPQTRFVKLTADFALANFAKEDSLLLEARTFCPWGEPCDEAMVLRALTYPLNRFTDREDLSYRYRTEGRFLPDQPSLLDLPKKKLEEKLGLKRARLLLLRDAEQPAKLRPDWESAGRWGPYHFLMRKGDRLKPGCAALLRTMRRAFADEAAEVR